MRPLVNLLAYIRRFHAGTLSGRGRVQVTPAAQGGSHRPYMCLLAFAGLTTAIAVSSPEQLMAQPLGQLMPPPENLAMLPPERDRGKDQDGIDRLLACTMAIMQVEKLKTVEESLAAVSGIEGEIELPVELSLEEIKAFAEAHEWAHCDDELQAVGAFSRLPPREREYLQYKREVFADVAATIQMARQGREVHVAETFSDLRIVGLLMHAMHDTENKKRWARYYTTASVDAALAWLETLPADQLSAMSDEEVYQHASRIRAETVLDLEAHAHLTDAMPRASISSSGEVKLPDGLPEGFQERLVAAIERQNLDLGHGNGSKKDSELAPAPSQW